MVKGVQVMNSFVMSLYRLSGGRIANRMGSAPIMLLTTKGFKSGKQRTNPVLYLTDEANLVTVASAGGSDKNPSWYANLIHNPEATVTIKREKRRVRGRKATPEERKKFWPLMTAAYPGYANYQKKTKREIPVVILSPA